MGRIRDPAAGVDAGPAAAPDAGPVASPDVTPPALVIEEPASGATLPPGPVTLAGTASDEGGSGVQSVEIRLDGGSWQAAEPRAPEDWSRWSLGISVSQEGLHHLEVRATDAAANQVTAEVAFTVSAPLPPRPVVYASVEYTVDESVFTNPERGFYEFYQTTPETDPYDNPSTYDPDRYDLLSASSLSAHRADPPSGTTRIHHHNVSLIIRNFYLHEFIAENLKGTARGDAFLANAQKDFDAIRTAGLKAIVRFSYRNEDQANLDSRLLMEAPKSQILAHIADVKDLLERNRDVILVVQAGYIGPWGEWHSSDHFGGDFDPGRAEVFRALLQATPAERMVQICAPHYKQAIFSTGSGVDGGIADSQAYDGSDVARAAHFNDCFLAGPDDASTYRDPGDRPYLAQETRYLAMGGETCRVSAYSGCTEGLAQLEQFHWSFLNADWHTLPDGGGVLDRWVTDGCMETIHKRLGYRFELERGSYPDAVRPGGELELQLSIHNSGWAAPFNRRAVELVLRKEASGELYRVLLPEDPRRWQASATHSLQQAVCAPTDMPAGRYELLLHLPDPEPALFGRPEYAIRLANLGVWEPETGFNRLLATIEVDPRADGPGCTSGLMLQRE